MNKNQSFQRKIIYGVCMIVLLVAISLISRPATSDDGNPGGLLAQLRKEHRISDAQLGKVDPASEAMRLSLLGLDGVAITILWNNLNEYQKTEQYTLMEATARTISYLNPHLLKVWEFQSWNMSYNVSREFDNYEHRYLWVKRGLNYHMQGTEYNYNEPRMMNSIAHSFGNKLGTADEKEQYRELFPDDDLFHSEIESYIADTAYSLEDAEGVIEGKPDNWLVARIWNRWATQVVDNNLGSIGAMSPTIFYQYPAKRLMNFGEAVEKEGYVTEKAQAAWAQAYDEWLEYGDHELPSTYGFPIKLNDAIRLAEEIQQQQAIFDEQYGQYRETVYQQKFDELDEQSQEALNTPPEERTEEQVPLARAAERSVEVSNFEIITYMRDNGMEGTVEAAKLANQIHDAEFLRGVIERQKGIVAFDYWLTRAESERTDRTLRARRLLFEAQDAVRSANLVRARQLYEQSWELWAQIYEDYPQLRGDASADDLADAIKEYREFLGQFNEDISPDFPLIDILRQSDENFVEPAPTIDRTPAQPPADESETDAATDPASPAEAEAPAAPSQAPPAASDDAMPAPDAAAAEPAATEPEPAAEDTQPMPAPMSPEPMSDPAPAADEASADDQAPMPEQSPAAEGATEEAPAGEDSAVEGGSAENDAAKADAEEPAETATEDATSS